MLRRRWGRHDHAFSDQVGRDEGGAGTRRRRWTPRRRRPVVVVVVVLARHGRVLERIDLDVAEAAPSVRLVYEVITGAIGPRFCAAARLLLLLLDLPNGLGRGRSHRGVVLRQVSHRTL